MRRLEGPAQAMGRNLSCLVASLSLSLSLSLCMYVYIYIYLYICIYTYIHIYIRIYTYMRIYLHVYIFIFIHKHIGLFLHLVLAPIGELQKPSKPHVDKPVLRDAEGCGSFVWCSGEELRALKR